MVKEKISGLGASTALASTDLVAVVQSATTKKADIDDIYTYINSQLTLWTPTIFSAYDAAGDITISGSETDITWDTENIKDSGYTHSADSAEITVGATGDYRISVDLTVYNSSGSYCCGYGQVRKDSGGGYADIAGMDFYTFNYSTTYKDSTMSASLVVSLTASDKIKVVAGRNAGSATIKTRADACRIVIEKL